MIAALHLHPLQHGFRRWAIVAVLLGTLALTACGGSSTPSATSTAATGVAGAGASAPAGGGQVLPVAANPIANTSTVQALVIDSVLVENNVDQATGKDANDHLEITLTNTGATELTGFEVFYTFADSTTGDVENYYAQLPDSFRIPVGGSRVAHFDNSGAPDHFPENDFSLYHTSLNALDITVEVSATGAAPQTTTVQKDAGGSETAD